MADLLKADERLTHHSPRIDLLQVATRAECPAGVDLNDPSWKYATSQWNHNATCERKPGGCYWAVCSTTGATMVRKANALATDVLTDLSVSLSQLRTIVLNNKREKEMQYGRGWNLSDDLPMGEAYLSYAMASRLHYQIGDTIMLFMNMSLLSERSRIAELVFGNHSTQ